MTVMLRLIRNGIQLAQCDRRCYNATTKRCRCICNGMNHAVGIQQAITNCHEIANDPDHHPQLPKPQGAHIQNVGRHIPIPPTQLALFNDTQKIELHLTESTHALNRPQT